MKVNPRILFCGGGHGAIAALTGLIKSGYTPDVLSEDFDVNKLAIQNNLFLVKSIKNWIKSKTDIAICAAHKNIIQKSILNEITVLNIHYALLPKYRGYHPIVWAILNGEKEVGWTIHEMDERADGGPIIYQESINIGTKTSWDLMLEINNIVHNKLGLILQKYIEKELMPISQDESRAIFVAKRNERDCQINWETWDIQFIKKAFQALVHPYPIPFFIYKNNKYEITKYEIHERNYLETPGRVVYRDFDSVWIKINGGLLQVWQVKCKELFLNPLEIFSNTGARIKWT